MRHKLVIPIIILSVMLAGCISEKLPENATSDTEKKITIKYVDRNPIVTDKDFPDFKLLDRIYYVAQENLTTSLEIEGIHRESSINDTQNVPDGYRIYGLSEAYNSSEDADNYDRYMLLQYKVFDSNEKLNDSINLTIINYVRAGFKSKVLDNETLKNASYKGRVFIFESNITNRTDANVTIILFGYDTILGKIGVQDSKDRSFTEALKMLGMVFDRLEINTKRVKPTKIDMSDPGMADRSNRTYNGHRTYYNTTNKT